MEEHYHVLLVLPARELGLQPRELFRAHSLGRGFAEVSLAGLRIGFVGVEHDEPAILVIEGVAERAEVQFVVGFVFLRRAVFN